MSRRRSGLTRVDSPLVRLKAWSAGGILLLAAVDCRRAAPTDAAAQVVFVCEHGAAKSVIAAAYFNKLATERGSQLRAIARGADPQPDPSRATLAGLQVDGLPAPRGSPQPLNASAIRTSTRVVVFDCDTPTMKALNAMGTCWNGVPVVADDYNRARDDIRVRVLKLFEESVP